MGADSGNQNAKKVAGPRVSVCLSIADERERKRKSWAIRRLQARGVEHPTPQDINRYVKDFCYQKIDEDMYDD